LQITSKVDSSELGNHGDYKLKVLQLLLLGLIIFSCLFPSVKASTLSVELQNGTANVTIAATMQQNFTALQDQVIDLKGQDLEAATNALRRALETKSSGMVTSDVSFKIVTSKSTLNVTVLFKVENISSVAGKVTTVDLTWKSFNIPDDLVTQDLSYNLFGNTYVKPIVLSYSNSTWARFYLNETRSVFYQDAADAAGNATLLDFRALSKSLASWNRTIDLKDQKTTWFFPSERVFDLRVDIEEPNGTRSYYSKIEVSSNIVGPDFATVNGDLVISTQSGIEEPLMLAVVIVVLAIAVGLHMYERKMRKKAVRPRR